MKTRILLYQLFFACLACVSVAEEVGSKPKVTEEPLTPEAQAAVAELKQQLSSDSEAIAMLDNILAGSRLAAEDGWFPLAKSQTRFDWEYVRKHYDADANQAIKATEFPGSQADFTRLDRNRDQQITAADFDWSKNSLTPSPGFTMFFMADRDANGKVTKEEFSSLYDQMRASVGEEDFLAIDDLRDQFTPGPPSNSENRPDKPSRSTLVMGLKNQEIGSLQPGPNLNDPAPDFILKTLEGKPVKLSDEIGDKPIVLIFGNFTCGPFRSQSGNIEKLYNRYQDRVKMFLVYVREAHPSDGWWMKSNQQAGINPAQPNDHVARVSVAATCQKRLDLKIPFLVDDIDDRVGATYSGMPNRLYLIDQDGKIAFKNGRGPFGFHPRQLEQALILLLNSNK